MQEIDQFSSDIQDFEAYLKKKVDMFDDQSPIVVDTDKLVDQEDKF